LRGGGADTRRADRCGCVVLPRGWCAPTLDGVCVGRAALPLLRPGAERRIRFGFTVTAPRERQVQGLPGR